MPSDDSEDHAWRIMEKRVEGLKADKVALQASVERWQIAYSKSEAEKRMMLTAVKPKCWLCGLLSQ